MRYVRQMMLQYFYILLRSWTLGIKMAATVKDRTAQVRPQ
jgi:hypothetical protein